MTVIKKIHCYVYDNNNLENEIPKELKNKSEFHICKGDILMNNNIDKLKKGDFIEKIIDLNSQEIILENRMIIDILNDYEILLSN